MRIATCNDRAGAMSELVMEMDRFRVDVCVYVCVCVCVCVCAARHEVARERNCGGDLDVLSFIRICLWSWIGRVNRMDSNRRVSQEFNKNSQRSRIRGWPKNR